MLPRTAQILLLGDCQLSWSIPSYKTLKESLNASLKNPRSNRSRKFQGIQMFQVPQTFQGLRGLKRLSSFA